MTLLLALALPAEARPNTSVGFTSTDVVELYEAPGSAVRVHYSVEGPSQTRIADTDGDGTPDFVGTAGEVGEASLVLFETLGLHPLRPESDFGLDSDGSDASDIYMIEFQSGADGAWRSEACDDDGCAGYLTIDNRFDGYQPATLGLEIVVPHELFHGIQANYAPDWPVWVSEGTATWSEQQFLPDNYDFLGFSAYYLEDVGRPVDRPPGGPVPGFAYGTAIFFDFLTLRHDADLMHEMLTLMAVDLKADEDADVMPAIDAALQARSDSLEAAFIDFARYNLATGSRAGQVDSYPYAERLTSPGAEERGSFLDTDPRYFRYATVYLRFDHDGGGASIQWEADHPEVHLELFPTNGDGQILPSIWEGTIASEAHDFGDLAEGTYWLLGTAAQPIEQSINARVCLGPTADVEACFAADPGDTDTDVEPEGCGCASGGRSGTLALGVLALALVRRRDRT
ncbi:MAG: MYXO-CTERM sorting domain-containing protein [Myxococcota bacterium]